ncbi:hypothetical protein NQ317_017378 [Molorchus minor]|uniref:Uncharacterized protein n=1 Tax=Molorchus minor TaxID=1323400 RepID=A0ABQ9JC10_9CUCU|nr:hypothetical protein NQ317_017378 [Molorchus minor]
MLSVKIVPALLLAVLALLHHNECSVLPHVAAAPAYPAIRYGLVAPQNIRPFAAQVSTFTKGLNVFAAPYAAGVLSGPALVPAPAAIAPAPLAPAAYPAVAPASFYPAVGPAVAPAALPPAGVPIATSPYFVGPSPLLPGPFARSIHAVAPGLAPAFPAVEPAVPASPFLG